MTIEILTADEVGELLRLSPNRVILLARRGKIPSLTIDGHLRFDAQAIEDWLRSRCKGAGQGRVEIEEFTTEEGGKWLRWAAGWASPTKDQLDGSHLLKRYAHNGSLVVRLKVGDGFLNVHSLRLKNGREWDAVNNWRGDHRPAMIRVGIPKGTPEKKRASPRKTRSGRKK